MNCDLEKAFNLIEKHELIPRTIYVPESWEGLSQEIAEKFLSIKFQNQTEER